MNRVLAKEIERFFLYALFVHVVIVSPLSAQERDNSLPTMLRIGRLSSPITLDGKLDESAWKHAAVMEGFTNIEGSYPRDATTARMAYDKKNLYLAFECQQRILNPVLQKLDEFKMNLKGHDEAVWKDDSVEIFIAPKGDKNKYFHFAFNALGTRYEALAKNREWNGVWDVTCRVEDGQWTAEVKIPLKTVGLTSIIGDAFSFNVCRNQKADSEHSSWSPVSMTFHDIHAFAFGKLNADAAVVRADSFVESLSKGDKPKDLKLSVQFPKPGSYTASVSLSSLDRKASEKTLKDTSSKGTYTFPLDFGKGIRHALQYSLTSPDGQTLFRSPEYTVRKIADMVAHIVLTSGKLSRSIINSADLGPKNRVVLRKGMNDIALECTVPKDADGRVKGYLQIDASSDSPKCRIPIDEQWSIETSSDENGTVKLSRRVAVGTSVFYPVARDNVLYIAQDTAQHAFVVIINPTNKTLKKLTFTLDIPKGLELVGIENEIRHPKAAYPKNGRLVSVSKRPSDVVKGNQQYVFVFNGVKPFGPRGMDWSKAKKNIHGLVFRLKPGAASPLKVYYRTEGDNEKGAYIESWNTLKVVPVQITKAKRPKQLKTVLWHGPYAGTFSDIEADALVKTFADVGFNAYVERLLGSPPVKKTKERYNWLNALKKNHFFIIMEIAPRYFLRGMAREYPDDHSVNFQGKQSHHLPLQPGFILGPLRDRYCEYIKSIMETTGAQASMWDLEFPPFKVCDVSENTRKRFTAFAGLKTIPAAEEIQTQYREQWISFMCDFWAQFAKIYWDGTKAAGKDKQVWLYSGYPSARNRERYAIDWSLMKGKVDVAAMGYKIPSISDFQILHDLGMRTNPGVLYFVGSNPEVSRTLKNKLLRGPAEGSGGVMLFHWTVLDGRAYRLISEAFGLLADHEVFFVEAKRTRPNVREHSMPLKDIYLLMKGNKQLLLVFNDSKRSGKAVVNLGKSCTIHNYYTGEKSTGNIVDVRIQPWDVAAYVIDE